MHIHLEKKGIRAFGVAESFKEGFGSKSILGGVVMRSDLIVDGFIFGSPTIKGDDASDEIVNIFNRLGRNDINVVLVSGLIISMYNIIDIDYVANSINTPVIGITFKDSRGLEEHIKRHFPKFYDKKIEAYRRLGKREIIRLQTGYTLYVRAKRLTIDETKKVLNKFTIQGAIPEPIRLAKLLAKAKLEFLFRK